jgi:NADPH-dependent F420 reductase
MDVTIIGAGNMARAIGTRLATADNVLQILDRDPDKARALASELSSSDKAEITGGQLGSEAARGEVIVLAVPYTAVAEIVKRIGDQLAGHIVVDITNPVDFGTFDGMVTPPDSSAAEEIAKLLPDARLVKAFNTNFSKTLVEGSVGGLLLDVFIAGDDTETVESVTTLVEQGGLHPIPVGPLRRARELEAMGFLHMVIQEPLSTQFASALKVVS